MEWIYYMLENVNNFYHFQILSNAFVAQIQKILHVKNIVKVLLMIKRTVYVYQVTLHEHSSDPPQSYNSLNPLLNQD